MNKNLLIVGAGQYGTVAKEIAQSMGCFEKIDFVDDVMKATPDGVCVIGTTENLEELAARYTDIAVAIGNPDVRLSLIERIKRQNAYRVVSLISPQAYVSPSARLACGCVIEPLAVVHANCVLNCGCIISAGAVVNHAAECGEGVHVDCNATVEGYCRVPEKTKVRCGTVYGRRD